MAIPWEETIMPAPDNSDRFPDMSLPERTASPAEPRVERSAAEGAIAKGLPALQTWKVGGRVLAPWEPAFLYAGTIQSVERQRALIQFDDGDSGWVPLDLLREVSVKPGQKVFSRRKMGALFYAGEVAEVSGDEVRIRFESGVPDEWTRIAALRIPNDKNDGRGAEPIKVASNEVFLQSLRPGQRVWAPWNPDLLHVGVLDKLTDQEAHIRFEDGSQGWVQLVQLLPFDPVPGLMIFALVDRQFLPAAVVQLSRDRVQVRLDNGTTPWIPFAALALPIQPVGPPARPTNAPASGPTSSLWSGWGIGIAIAIALALLRAFMR